MFSKIRISGRGIVVSKNRILLNKFGEGEYYNFPGGGVEPGETAKEAAVREVFEETGLKVRAESLLYVFDYEPVRNNFSGSHIPHISLVFECSIVGDDIIKPAIIPDIDPVNPGLVGKAVWVDFDMFGDIKLVPEINGRLLKYVKNGIGGCAYLEMLNQINTKILTGE